MRWLKHMTATWDDEKIARLVKVGGRDGLAAYGLWWRVVEIVASAADSKSNKNSVTYPVTRWSVLLSVRGSHVRSLLDSLVVTHLVTAEWIGDDVTVTIPNLLKYRDEYARKSGYNPDNIPAKNRTDTDTEGEYKNIPPTGVGDVSPKEPASEPQKTPDQAPEKISSRKVSEPRYSPGFLRFWGVVWAKIAIADAWRAWKATVRPEDEDLVIIAAEQQKPKLLQQAADQQRSVIHPATWIRRMQWKDEEPVLPFAQPNGHALVRAGPADRKAREEAKYDEMLKKEALRRGANFH